MRARLGLARPPAPGPRPAERVRAPSGLPQPALLVRLGFILFVASIPFETVHLGLGTASLSRMLGWIFIVLALLQPAVCFRKPPAAFWWFAAFLAVFLVNRRLQGTPYEGGARTLPQMLVLLWVASNLLRYRGVFLSTLNMLVVSCVVFSLLQLGGVSSSGLAGRETALEEDPNSAGAVLTLGLVAVVGIAYGRRRSGRLTKVVALLCFGVIGLGVVRTGSRGALVSLAAGIGVLVLQEGSIGLRVRNAVLVATGLVVLIVMSLTWEVSRKRWEATVEQGSMAGRERIYPVAWKMFLDRPVFGWGPGMNIHRLGVRLAERRDLDTHNLYLWVLTEDGLAGSIPYFLGVWLCVRAAWLGRKRAYGVVPLAMLSVVLLVNGSVTWQYRKLYWVVLGLALASARPLQKATGVQPLVGRTTAGGRRRISVGRTVAVRANV
jgi:O-antigen ligase